MAVLDSEPLQTPSLSDVISTAIEGLREDIHTCQWGTVLSFDAASQTASVQLIQRRAYVDEDGVTQTERPAPLLGVPVVFPGSGAYTITFPIKGGDTVLIVFGETALDAWHSSGQDDVDPQDNRRHALSDAIAIPGLRSKASPIGGPPPDDALVVTGDHIRLGSKDASDQVALVPGVQQAIQSAYTDSGVQSAVAAYQTAIGTPGEAAALAALNVAFTAHWLAHPVQGAQKVTAE